MLKTSRLKLGERLVGLLLLCAVLVPVGAVLTACGEPEPTLTPVPTVPPATIVTFPDANLEAAIRIALRKVPGEKITAGELAELVELRAIRRDIANLIGIEHLSNLRVLNLAGNQTSDISPLASLSNLTLLVLSWNQISDISPLASLTNLSSLLLMENQISDISPLTSLSNLTSLNLAPNQISDISVLASLSNLTDLQLWENQISDISHLISLSNLTALGLSSNLISDISPLVENNRLGVGSSVTLRGNPLDFSEGSKDLESIRQLEKRGVQVFYR